MHIRNRTLPLLFLVVLPIAVAGFQLHLLAAVILVLLTLAWKWLATLSELVKSPVGPALRLETISVSHFVEKVRWSLDRLGVPYKEEHTAGILGALFRGRTVPTLHARTGRVTSVIGNSPEILRYLWGTYGAEQGDRATFLQPTPTALELEHRFDEYGVDLQRWIYSHILSHKQATLRIWGHNDPTLPVWQRTTLTVLYPLLRLFMQRVFRLSQKVQLKPCNSDGQSNQEQ